MRNESRIAGLTDEALLEAIADGNRVALRELYDRHAPWLVARLRRRCADPAVVADTVQDTFVAVWRSAGSYDGRGPVGAWIWGIGVRRMIGHFRTQSRLPALWDERDPETSSRATLTSAEELVLAGVEHGDLAGALDRLSPELRAVVQATVLDGLTTREASKLLGIPTGTVKTRMMRARVQLREGLT